MTVISMDSLHTEELREALQKNLRKFRTAAGFSQEELSQLLGMNRATYTYYETGKTRPDLATLVTLAEIFQTTVDGLLGTAAPPKRKRENESPVFNLLKDEKQVICLYRSLPEAQRARWLDLGKGLAREVRGRTPKPAGREKNP